MSIVTPKICSMAATDSIAIMILSKREMAPGLLSHFMNSPSDCFVSQSDDCASFDKAFECGAIEAKMSIAGSVCMAVNNVRVFTGKPWQKNGECSCPRNFHNPSFCRLFRPAGGIPFIIIIISQSFYSSVALKMFFIQVFVSFF